MSREPHGFGSNFKSSKSLVCAAVLSALVSQTAIAQEDEAKEEETSGIEQITVTAEKRTETLQEVSVSVSAFGEDDLVKGGITDVSRLELAVPGVNFAFAGNDAKFNVRGANSSNTFGDNSSIVGAFVDGVYKARASQQTRAFFDVRSVEFLRGPQGTLYGRNTFAGALNLYTNAPDFSEVSGGIDLSYQAFDRVRGEAFFNAPLSDKVAVRIATYFDKSDGYIENLAGPDVGAQDDKAVRISVAIEPTDDLEILLRYSRSEEDGNEAGLFGYTFLCRNETPEGLTDPFGSVRNCANPVRGSGGRGPAANGPGGDPYVISQDYVRPVNLKEDVFSAHINYEFENFSVKSITSYTDFFNDINFDFDFSPTPNSNGGFLEASKVFSQEIQFSSNYDSDLRWTVGAYYSDQEDQSSFSIYQQTARDDSTRATITNALGTFTQLSGTDITSLNRNFGGFFADNAIIDTEYFGIFGQIEYSISEDLRVIAGIRYNDESKELSCGGSNFTGDVNGDGNVDRVVNVRDGVAGSSPIILPGNSRDVFSFNCGASDAITSASIAAANPNLIDPDYSNVTWRAGLEYDVAEDAMVYLSASTGYLSGSVNTTTVTDEQESQVIEAGFRTRFLDNTVQFNGAIHFTEYTNLLTQLQRVEGGVAVTFSENGGEIDAQGIELDAIWLVTEDFQITANMAYLDSEFGRFGQGNPYQLFNGQVRSFIDQNGERTPWSPELTIGASASYVIELGEGMGTLTPYLQFYYSDEYNTSNLLATDPSHQQDSFTKTDLRLIWNSVDEDYSVELFVENIEDEAVLARGNNNSDDVVQSGYLYPRNYGLRFKTRF